MAKKKPTFTLPPPSEGLPPSWNIDGLVYTIVSTVVRNGAVGVKDNEGRLFYANFKDIRERLTARGIIK